MSVLSQMSKGRDVKVYHKEAPDSSSHLVESQNNKGLYLSYIKYTLKKKVCSLDFHLRLAKAWATVAGKFGVGTPGVGV